MGRACLPPANGSFLGITVFAANWLVSRYAEKAVITGRQANRSST